MAEFISKGNSLYIDGKRVLEGWESFSGMYWFGIKKLYKQDSVINGKVHKNDQIWYGYVQGQYSEWGNFSEAELSSMRGKVWKIPQKALHYSGRQE